MGKVPRVCAGLVLNKKIRKRVCLAMGLNRPGELRAQYAECRKCYNRCFHFTMCFLFRSLALLGGYGLLLIITAQSIYFFVDLLNSNVQQDY